MRHVRQPPVGVRRSSYSTWATTSIISGLFIDAENNDVLKTVVTNSADSIG